MYVGFSFCSLREIKHTVPVIYLVEVNMEVWKVQVQAAMILVELRTCVPGTVQPSTVPENYSYSLQYISHFGFMFSTLH